MISFNEFNCIEETANAGLAAKSAKSGISIGILRKVYNRGMAAWNSGHRPGTTPQQWAMARVNSYIGKGKGTYYGADKDLHESCDCKAVDSLTSKLTKPESYEAIDKMMQAISKEANMTPKELHNEFVKKHGKTPDDYAAGLSESESWEAGYSRRVVKTTSSDHKEKGFNWRIKGKERPEISIKLYKEKPSQAEFNKQMKRVAGHEFGEEFVAEAVAKDSDSGLPKKYVSGMSDTTAKARAAHFKKADKLSDSDPEAYKPAPGDAGAKTKESKHTKKYREIFGEGMDEEVYEACWDGYKQIGTKKKGNRMVPNCVLANEKTIDKQKPYVSSDGKGNYEVLGNTGQTKATFTRSGHGKDAQKNAQMHLKKNYDTYMKEDLKAMGKNEEVEQIDELNKDTVYSYAQKSNKDMEKKHKELSVQVKANKPVEANRTSAKLSNRDKGLDRAEKRLNKEELSADEQFDLIEEVVMELAELHNLDPELIWEKFKDIEDAQLYEYAIDAKGHKSSTGGLTQKGVDAYNAKTGGNLKTAVTTKPSKLKPGSKAANRRKSFCARMGGMKKRLTSAKTAKDPDSRINKALRKWNC